MRISIKEATSKSDSYIIIYKNYNHIIEMSMRDPDPARISRFTHDWIEIYQNKNKTAKNISDLVVFILVNGLIH